MAEVVRLEAGEEPPDNEDWVLVVVDVSGRYAHGATMVRHRRGATFQTSGAEAEVAIIIQHAQAWADVRSIRKVYVQQEAA
jgi:hypothetical protein